MRTSLLTMKCKDMDMRHFTLPHPCSHSPCSHDPEAGIPFVALVARLVIRLGHKGGAAVQEHVMNNVIVLNYWLNLRERIQE